MNFVQPVILVGGHGNRKAKFLKKKKKKKKKKHSKIYFLEAIRGMKLKLCIHVHDNSLCINCVLFVLSICFHCYSNLKFR